ncbi:TRAP transporter substrate-binding protein [Elioraea sp.]|jgi:tripartite ATP-independent transporter DctP family solute receptor|uniref:TRAP transporter substrate-binding protein n=1 Tax=Elioraea sp. TaxID=2185103 RepID=UPI003F7285F2
MRTLAAGAVLAMATGLFAVPAAAQNVDIQYGTTSPPGNVQYYSSEEFIKRVNARIGSFGRIVLYHSSQLGSDGEMLQKLRLGTQDMSQPSTIMSSVTPEFGMFDLPYLVKDRAHMRCIAREIVWPILAPKVEARGYKIIGIWENGFRHITNNVRPIVTPADLRGLKIRVPQGVWRVKMFQAYGASPSPLPFSEVFVALQTGVMDGQENPYVNVDAGKFQEVQRYLTETRHIYTPSFPTASLRKFRGYPEPVQRAILEEAAAVQDWTYELAERLETEVRDKLIAAGMRFNQSDRDAFVAASKPVYDQFAAEVPDGAALIERALALANGC